MKIEFKKNPIPEILTDKDYEILTKKGLINYVNLRNYLIYKDCIEFKKIKKHYTIDFFFELAVKYNLDKETVKKYIYGPVKLLMESQKNN